MTNDASDHYRDFVLFRWLPRLPARIYAMSDEAYVTLIMSGLVGCYWAGYKFGTWARIIKNLGKSA